MEWDPPLVCGNGHRLEPPHVKVAWVQCQCSRATGRPKGHLYAACTRCWWEARANGCDRLVNGYEVRSDGATGSAGDGSIPARTSCPE